MYVRTFKRKLFISPPSITVTVRCSVFFGWFSRFYSYCGSSTTHLVNLVPCESIAADRRNYYVHLTATSASLELVQRYERYNAVVAHVWCALCATVTMVLHYLFVDTLDYTITTAFTTITLEANGRLMQRRGLKLVTGCRYQTRIINDTTHSIARFRSNGF